MSEPVLSTSASVLSMSVSVLSQCVFAYLLRLRGRCAELECGSVCVGCAAEPVFEH